MNVLFTGATAADSALVAMENVLVLVIVPKLAVVAIVRCQDFSTFWVNASLRGRLGCSTKHAQTISSHEAVYFVVRCFIVAEPARIPLSTAIGHELAVSLVVGTAEFCGSGAVIIVEGGIEVGGVDFNVTSIMFTQEFSTLDCALIKRSPSGRPASLLIPENVLELVRNHEFLQVISHVGIVLIFT